MCLSKEAAQHVYEAVLHNKPVAPLYIEPRSTTENIDPEAQSTTLYEAALFRGVDCTNSVDPLDNLHSSDLLWSLLSTEISYKIPKKVGSYSALNESPLYASFNDIEKMPLSHPDTYLDRFEEVTSLLMTSKQFDDTTDVTTTYLGQFNTTNKSRQFIIENKIPLAGNCTVKGTLLDQTPLSILFDTGATRSYMSKSFYMSHPQLHQVPKFTSTCKGILVGNGQQVSTMFVIPLHFLVQGHYFEIYTLVADLHDGIDLVFGLKNMVETEGIMNAAESCYQFISRSNPIYLTHDIAVKPDQKVYLKFSVPFCEEMSGQAIAQFYEKDATQTIKVRIVKNQGVVLFINKSKEDAIFQKNEAIGVIDLRSLGYYKVQYQDLLRRTKKHFNMFTYYKLKPEAPVEDCSEQYMRTKQLDKRTVNSQDGYNKKNDPYPHLAPDDPRRGMTDSEILRTRIDLTESDLTSKEKGRLMQMILKYKKAFSLRDEIGECPNLKADLKIIDDSPFFVRPFPISEQDKPIMDKQMERLVSLGILSKNSTSHTSPVMLITRKVTQDKRPVVDFRLLNTRILRRNTSIPLMSDVLSILGSSRCEILSCLDLKDAFHSIPLTDKSKEYCGILPYFGSPIYRYEVLPMGLAVSPQIWTEYITILLNDLENKTKYIAIMDDLLIHSTKREHWTLLEQLLQAMIKNGLKLSPKKCQLFRTRLTYMGNEFVIRKGSMTITPLKSRTEAISKIPTPKTAKQCKSFCGVVNYLSLFCPDLQSLLKPIVGLTRKGVPFIWGKHQEAAFYEVKKRLASPPVLHLPRAVGRFILYADTSKTGTGSSLWQIQEGKPRLIGYASKTLPEACSRYSATELEMTGLLVNIGMWKNILKHREFDAAVDHLAITQILKAKTEPATARLMRLLDRLSSYSFLLYYVKGRDMILADYLSRTRTPDKHPEDLIPISFCAMVEQVIDKGTQVPFDPLECYTSKHFIEQFNVTTRSQTKASGEAPPVVHGKDKPLDPHSKPERQKTSAPRPPRPATKTRDEAPKPQLLDPSPITGPEIPPVAPPTQFPTPPAPSATYPRESRVEVETCLLYTSPSPRDGLLSRMPSSA